jgi:hypothetical protein
MCRAIVGVMAQEAANEKERSGEEIRKILGEHSCVISYEPLVAEVNPFVVFPEFESVVAYTIAPNRELDPAEEARAAQSAARAERAIVLLPGRRFDAAGTRHGKGFGWYDRFLSAVPKDWLRVAFCFSDQFSAEPLVRAAWDEPVDFVCVVDKNSGDVTFYETRARVY